MGGQGGLPLFLNSCCPILPKSPAFGITLRHHFLADQLQIFSKGAYGSNIINFEEGASAEKNTQFFGQSFPKSAQNRLLFLKKKIACGEENF